MNKVIIRRLDDFGRITLPHDMRRAMHLEESDPVEIVYEDKRIRIVFNYQDQLAEINELLEEQKVITEEAV